MKKECNASLSLVFIFLFQPKKKNKQTKNKKNRVKWLQYVVLVVMMKTALRDENAHRGPERHEMTIRQGQLPAEAGA